MSFRQLDNAASWIRRSLTTQQQPQPQPLIYKTRSSERPVRPWTASLPEPKPAWWKDAVIYQVYVPSFKDTNGDGYGDLRGVTEKLDYLAKLGVKVLWLSPIFDSPMYDMGYDTSDYYTINPLYGSMDDFNALLEEAHKRGLRIILDIALNHTSAEHSWFKKSVAAHKGECPSYRDYYIWGDPIVDKHGNKRPPSNWGSVFQGSMWEWVPEISKYYLHVFGREQPDLNWESPDVRKEVWNVLRFWLDKGVDGFRLDAINCTSKAHNKDLSRTRPGQPTASNWPDAPITKPETFEQKCNEMFANGPRVHEYLREMHDQVFAHYDALSLGEMSCGITPELGVAYTSREPGNRQLDLVLHFEHVELDCIDGDKWMLREWELPELKGSITRWQKSMDEAGGWDTVWMENHDQPRGMSRFCSDATLNREHAAKLLAMWMLTLKGTVIIFQGQELGLTNPEEFSEDAIRDIETRIYWEATSPNAPVPDARLQDLATVKKAITTKSRDAIRIPIPWNNDHETSGGFTNKGATPWLPAHPRFADFCAEEQCQNPSSPLSFYHDMIRLREQHPTLIHGVYQLIDKHHASIFAYTRTHAEGTYLVVLNFSNEFLQWHMPEAPTGQWRFVMSTSASILSDQDLTANLRLGPYDGVICRDERAATSHRGCLSDLD